jgi:hypothetical protein
MIAEGVAFGEPVDYTDTQVAKLAQVVPAGGFLAVGRSENALRIWGFARSRPLSWSKDAFAVEILEPGTVRVVVGPFQPFAVFCGHSVSMTGGSRIALPDRLRRVLRKESMANDFVQTHVEWWECLLLAYLARMIVDEGHGGTVLIVPSKDGDWAASLNPFAFKFATPDRSVHHWIRHHLAGGQLRSEIIGRLFSTSLPDSDKTLIAQVLSPEAWNNRDILRPIVALAACDGAVVVTRDFEVLGFGAKIAVPSHAAEEVCIFRPEPGQQRVIPSPLEALGGTRHQSAARFVSLHKDTVAFVISADRHLSVVHWDESIDSVFFLRNAEWLM